MKMTVVKVDESTAEELAWGPKTWNLVDAKIGSKYSVVKFADFPPGAASPEHVREGEEMVYIIQGEMIVEIPGEESHTLTPGSIIFIPPGVKHCHRNVGKEAVKQLFILAGPTLK